MEKIIVEVISSACGHYQPGDKIFINDALVDKERSGNICLMAMQAIFPYIFAFRKGVTAEQMGFKEKIQVQCPDYCGPTVFELKWEE
ncbi:TIGR04076 family protein [Desulfotomaculum arcticum]|uniref:TIGR04076 family protein n=1 Tax=Desulfotruncus arcticus DSM 17038 TaxID=1121424 RepID=A0A1I2RJ57_9FIRM|nr:TIGR04076 family protein [Desulfotruncus arcticus]SFG37881.1 TIGR04076 family protein [Desulfotomaculum arcticum] [Desulfotruncus arcticus DSM 17038]